MSAHEWKSDLESWKEADEFPDAISFCYICKSRPITVEHIQILLRRGKVICTACGAIHRIEGGDIEVVGFRL